MSPSQIECIKRLAEMGGRVDDAEIVDLCDMALESGNRRHQMSVSKITIADVTVRVMRLRNHLGSAKALAEKIGISEQYLSDMLNSRREFSSQLLDAVGVYRYTAYEGEDKWTPGGAT